MLYDIQLKLLRLLVLQLEWPDVCAVFNEAINVKLDQITRAASDSEPSPCRPEGWPKQISSHESKD